MQVLREPLFLAVEFLNIYQKDKGIPAISVRVNLQRDDLVYVQSVKNRMEVIGYVHPETGLFIMETEDITSGSIYHRFRLEAVKYAREELISFLEKLEQMDKETYDKRNYKAFSYLSNALKTCLVDRQALYADLQKQVNLIASRKFPKVNEYLVFADEETIAHPVTTRVPYENPAHITLTPEEQQGVDKFLDVFFDEYNKFTFAWYLGAALSNVPLYDDRVSKLAILSSSLGGSGKSSLAIAMANALFTPHYRDIKDDFDSFFTNNNRFGTSVLSTKRLCIYSEASFHSDPLSEDHNFAGMNVSAIKSLVTEGYLSKEVKFGDRNMDRLSGFHLVLTNHPPVISAENQAMTRRILPIMLRPTAMSEKAKELHLWGRQKLDSFVLKHAKAFAAYFVKVFHDHEYDFIEQTYNHREYIEEIRASQLDLDAEEQAGRAQLDVLKTEGLFKFLEEVERQKHVNLTLLKADIMDTVGGRGDSVLSDYMKLDNGTLYMDSSKSFLLRYGVAGGIIREMCKEFYGPPAKKFHRRMFVIPFTK